MAPDGFPRSIALQRAPFKLSLNRCKTSLCKPLSVIDGSFTDRKIGLAQVADLSRPLTGVSNFVFLEASLSSGSGILCHAGGVPSA